MPTRQDVDLARAAIDRGFLTIKESVKCLEIQRDYENKGQQVPLERIFIETEFLTEEQLGILRESLAKSEALRHVGHYEIMSKVGAGGMGTVYQAKDRKADRIVALKVLSPAHASNREYIQRFLREAHASGQLSHPNIVQGYDAGEANGQYYFVMEFVDGITVADMLRDGRPIPEQQALDIAIQIAKALEHAEEHNLIHRDIKPDNIMITEEGVAKLADLGLARLTTADLPQERRSFGTAYYASPEQCEGIEELDGKTDMYSFGVTLFHMLAGRVPFDDESPEAIMVKHLEEKRPYLKDLNVQLSHGISKIVRKLMARNKRERYESMSGVVNDLTLVRMGRSPKLGERARKDGSRYRYRSPTGSWRTKRSNNRKTIIQVSACVGVGLAMLVLGFFLFQWALPGPGERTPPEPPTNDKPRPRPAHQIYLEDEVLAKRRIMPPDKFLEKLLSVADRYPNTESANRAELLAGAILGRTHREAQSLFRKLREAALELRNQQRYQGALDKLGEFPAKYRTTPAAAELAELVKETKSQAETALRKIEDAAGKLTAENKYDEAIALYRPVVKTFGIPAMTAKAASEVERLEEARAAEEKRKTEEARQRERERLERLRKDRLAIRTAVTEAKTLVMKSAAFSEAAEKLTAAADGLSSDEHKTALRRAAEDLETLQELLDNLKSAGNTLKGKRVTLTRKDDTKLEGSIFSISRKSLSVERIISGTKAIRSVDWTELAPQTIKRLAEMKNNGKLGPDDRRALAALFCFSGDADHAKAELDALATDPLHRDAARLRRKDVEFFAKGGPADHGT